MIPMKLFPVIAICLGWTTLTFAHDPGLSTATVQLRPDGADVALVLSVKDAAIVAKPDANQVGQSSSTNVEQRLRSAAHEALQVKCDGQLIPVEVAACSFDSNNNATVQLRLRARDFSTLTIQSRWLGLLPPGHRQFVSVRDAKGRLLTEKLLSANSDSVSVALDASDTKPAHAATENSFLGFVLLGVKHILTGYDHVLFLISLLVVSRNFVSTLKVITCFTVAHSITLALAALGVVNVPSSIVEPIIAASIIYVGIENLMRGDAPKGRGLLTFAFGLIHGLGFASVLRELGVGSTAREIAAPLLAFNLGVEFGQLLIAALVLPLIWKFSERPGFARRWLPACSVLMALAGGYWLVQRTCFV